jgi:hypothetical protein
VFTREDLLRAGVGHDRDILQRDVRDAAAALGSLAAASMVDQHVPHHLRGHREEVRARLPADVLLIDQPQVRLVHERGRLEKGAGCLTPHVTAGQAVELLVYEGDETIEGGRIAAAPIYEQACDLVFARHGSSVRGLVV